MSQCPGWHLVQAVLSSKPGPSPIAGLAACRLGSLHPSLSPSLLPSLSSVSLQASSLTLIFQVFAQGRAWMTFVLHCETAGRCQL